MTAEERGSGPRPVDEEPEAPTPGPVVGHDARRRVHRRVGSVSILTVPVAVVSLSFFPGHMSGDTLAQISQARDGGFTNQHAPLLGALWGLVWPLGVRPGWILVLQVVVFVCGTYLVLRSFFSGWVAATLAAVIALSPPVFGMLGYLSRDTWFTALLMATFGLLLWSSREESRRASLLLLAALAASWLALASRQNAIAAVMVANVGVVWLALARRQPGHRLRRRRRRRLAMVTAAGGVVTVGMFASQVAAAELIGVRNVHPEQYLFIYDLEVLSHDLRRNLFPADVMARRDLAVIDQYYNIDSVNPLLFTPDPPVPTPLGGGAVRSVGRAWKRNVTAHPVDYLEARGKLWLRQVSLTREADFIYHPAVDPNPWGMRVRLTALNDAARDYVEAFADPRTLDGGPLHRVWVYLLIATAGAVVLLRARRRTDQRLVGLLALSVVTHQAGLFFGAMGTQYRFQFPVVVVGVVVVMVLVQDVRQRRRLASRAPR